VKSCIFFREFGWSLEIDQDYLRTGTAIGSCVSHEH